LGNKVNATAGGVVRMYIAVEKTTMPELRVNFFEIKQGINQNKV